MAYAELKAKYEGRSRSVDVQMRSLIKASGTGALMELMGGGPGGAGQWGAGWAKAGKARQMYQMMRNWIYACVSFINKRSAAQPWMAGHYEDAPVGRRRPGRLSSKSGYDLDLIPRGISKAYSADIEPDPNHDVMWVLEKPNHLQGKSNSSR